MLISIETLVGLVIFQAGSGPPIPPLDPGMESNNHPTQYLLIAPTCATNENYMHFVTFTNNK